MSFVSSNRATSIGRGTHPFSVASVSAHAGGRNDDSTPMERHALAVIKRLQDALDEETQSLIAARTAELPLFNNRKGQGLVELNRAMAALGGAHLHRDVADQLARLKEKIDENMRILRLNISAVKEITVLLTDAIQEADSDGTYTPAGGLRRSA